MNGFTFRLAAPQDDGDIRRLLETNPVPGRITMSYERSPDYFLGCRTMGPFSQVLVARHRNSGEMAALACRAVRPLFLNGARQEIGYLGQLRVAEKYRGRWLVAKGFRHLADLHRDARTGHYLTTIIEENVEALGILVNRPRRHFPHYREITSICTLAMPIRRGGRSVPLPPDIVRGGDIPLERIIAFLQRQGAKRQFFPFLEKRDFHRDDGSLPGLDRDDFYVALDRGEIAGILGFWDQRAFKQAVVRGYSGILRRGRSAYNLAARLRRLPPLPRPGEELPMAYACFPCLAGDNPDIFLRLLETVTARARECGLSYLLLGLAEDDPLFAVARRRPHIPYFSRLYGVSWEPEGPLPELLDNRTVHVEIATF
jgi:hypothetical protein